ncbi:MAG TPA: translocation/assembly module TamB domain-containing protein, partial [Rhodothermales bacterium]|nr:translocation/assembly module TamB domain-containing protein [Rhodothermales bacterium]
PVLTGTVNLQSADFYLTDETTAAQFEPVTLTEADVLMLERNFGIRVTEADTSTFVFYDALAMDLTVTMDRDVWLRSRGNPDMNIQFTGSLDLQKEPYQDQQLFGTIDVIEERSYINQFGRRFNIQKGLLTFNGPATDPRLDIEAAYVVRSRGSQEAEITITLDVTGRLDELDIELGSDPQTDYTNIVSYIATGRPADKAFQLGGVQDVGAGLALGQLANIVEGAAGEELGLDVIEIQQDGLQGATVTAGKYLSPRLYAAVSWPISFSNTNRDNATTLTTTSQQFITLEYELYNWLLARLIARQSRAIQFKLLYEYSY